MHEDLVEGTVLADQMVPKGTDSRYTTTKACSFYEQAFSFSYLAAIHDNTA